MKPIGKLFRKMNHNQETHIRPNTLQIQHQQQFNESVEFIREAFSVWKSSSTKLNVVPDGHVQDVFHKLNLYPTKEQVNEMLHIAKLYTPTGLRGLTFGEFCVLTADFRRNFRTLNGVQNGGGQPPFSFRPTINRMKKNISFDQINASKSTTSSANGCNPESGPSISKENKVEPPEVFLGGSCNPTTWRADVAIPALKKLGISFYNPQVSQWTPDLIELEHRAKEKARILFFVMDSETRASAGAIEAAHIAGQNTKHLVLVLHPYTRKQTILNEEISEEEYLDLSRNQKLLKQLVTRRGLPVLDNIPAALQNIKGILSGDRPCRTPITNIGSRLISVRRSYDRVIGKNCENGLTIAQCHQALSTLGYRRTLITLDNLKQIILFIRDVTAKKPSPTSSTSTSSTSSATCGRKSMNLDSPSIDFNEFCILSSYLSILQQEISENSCVSPIKGTNLPPPPIFLTNTPEWLHNQTNKCLHNEEILNQTTVDYSKQSYLRYNTVDGSSSQNGKIFNSQSASEVMEQRMQTQIQHSSSNGSSKTDSSRDSDHKLSVNGCEDPFMLGERSDIHHDMEDDEDSDSNDSVFSTGSSFDDDSTIFDASKKIEARDIYLGGSCALRTNWRQDIAIPFLKSKQISYYLPTLHENLSKSQLYRGKKYPSSSLVEDEAADDGTLLYNPNVLDSSRVLLFIITDDTRSLAPMTLAAHYIGLGYNVVLCVQMLHEGCTIGNDKLTQSAVKDYNRGRTYLVDLAKRQGIPVYRDIKDALNCAIDKVKMFKTRCSV